MAMIDPQTNWRWVAIKTCLFVVGLIAFGALASLGDRGQPQPSQILAPLPPTLQAAEQEPASPWLSAGGHIWTGVVLWYGPGEKKMRVGEVLGGNKDYVDPFTGRTFNGVKVLMQSGRAEWKDRRAIVTGNWYIRSDDPERDRGELETYRF